jgi:hypothetical protein
MTLIGNIIYGGGIIKKICWVPVAHTCNPSYSGGRDQERSLKPAWANSVQDSSLKIPNTKRTDGVTQDVGPEFKPQYKKKKRKQENATN